METILDMLAKEDMRLNEHRKNMTKKDKALRPTYPEELEKKLRDNGKDERKALKLQKEFELDFNEVIKMFNQDKYQREDHLKKKLNTKAKEEKTKLNLEKIINDNEDLKKVFDEIKITIQNLKGKQKECNFYDDKIEKLKSKDKKVYRKSDSKNRKTDNVKKELEKKMKEKEKEIEKHENRNVKIVPEDVNLKIKANILNPLKLEKWKKKTSSKCLLNSDLV
ncbi:hypothetical protein O3M35_006230 [Rhynocoris fuscipes]|uniref:Uncharacterized protein n=1 Tax=Rhynocoris fuscipes TaxID=488301 RepID=A0AAW1DF35_9HEMI